jgi:hypothetical protein
LLSFQLLDGFQNFLAHQVDDMWQTSNMAPTSLKYRGFSLSSSRIRFQRSNHSVVVRSIISCDHEEFF